MAETHPTLCRSDYSDFGIEHRDDIRHAVFLGSAEALVAASLIQAHQIFGQTRTGKTMASNLPNGERVRPGSNAVGRVPGTMSVYRAGRRFVIERRLEDIKASRREACYAAVWKKENEARAEAVAWDQMRPAV